MKERWVHLPGMVPVGLRWSGCVRTTISWCMEPLALGMNTNRTHQKRFQYLLLRSAHHQITLSCSRDLLLAPHLRKQHKPIVKDLPPRPLNTLVLDSSQPSCATTDMSEKQTNPPPPPPPIHRRIQEAVIPKPEDKSTEVPKIPCDWTTHQT